MKGDGLTKEAGALEEQERKWKKFALPGSWGKAHAFFNGKSKVGGEVGGFCFITPGGNGRP